MITHAQLIQKSEHILASPLSDKYFINPILAGDYLDPSVLRVGDDYYMTHSSFIYYPGLLIWHSKDLINWEPLCRALKKYVGSVYAPGLFKLKEQYYIYFPANGTNWVITAANPIGPWSDPIDLKIRGIDPELVVGQNDRKYLHLDGGNVVELSEDGLSIKGDIKNSYKGWPIPEDWEVECMCLEGPKMIFKNGYYYLTSAQGGTAGPATSHMVVSARSLTPYGPWENSPYNPIIHTYNKGEKWHSKGHGSLIADKENNWWIVYHAYEKSFHTLGRQTLMEPIEWTHDGWFKVPSTVKTELPIRKPVGYKVPHGMTLSDDFTDSELGIQWSFYKEYNPDRFKINNGRIQLNAQGSSPADCAPLLCVPEDHSYEIQVEYQLKDGATGGLVLFYNSRSYAGLATDGRRIIQYRRAQQSNAGINTAGDHGFLKIVNIENTVSFYFSADSRIWDKLQRSIMTDTYNHNTFGEFLSLRVGLVSMGRGSVIFDNFIYKKYD